MSTLTAARGAHMRVRRTCPAALRLASLGALALLAGACAAAPAPARWDLLIAGGTVVDGTGAAGYTADVAVRADRIELISRVPLPRAQADRVIDAARLVVAPGFIDMHAHLEPLLDMPAAESHVRQGVTTAIGNPDGGGTWPLAPYLDSVRSRRPGMNVGFLVGHNTVRREVMGMANRAPTDAELQRMRDMVEQAMVDGAFGLSTGLRYVPGYYATTDEVVALAEPAAQHGGMYTSHLRDEGLDLIRGVQEALEIGRRARIPVVLTHHKAIGARMWGQSTRTLALIDSARAAGTDVMADQYPYTATHTGIGVLVPPWSLAGGDSAFRARLNEPALRDSIVAGIIWNLMNDRGGGDLRRIQFSSVGWDRSLEGRTLHDWAEREGLPTDVRTGAKLVLRALLAGGANAIYHVLDEADVERIMRHPWTAIASDGRLSQPGTGYPHPRAYGTFPRVLAEYVRNRHVLTLEKAVRRMTALPVQRLGLQHRGTIAVGHFADIVIFNAGTVADRATFAAPHQYPDGIPFVLVNGRLAVDRGRFTDVRAGVVLRHRTTDDETRGRALT